MRNLITTILTACLVIIYLTPPAQAQMVTMNDALTVADNWINVIIRNKGDWGGSRFARVGEIQEFRRGERILGYFCTVEPQGFIVISLHKALAPVKAYSEVSNLDPRLDEGMADLIKGKMESILDAIEQQIGRIELARIEEVEKILEISYRHAWEALERGGLGINMNYQEGEPLLTSNWHQGDPYNRYCPTPQEVGNDDCTEDHCAVGCVALAGAQIMRYWAWPPDFGFDWPNMPDELGSDQGQINAVAALCRQVGDAVGMKYCSGGEKPCESSAFTSDMEDVYEKHYRYSDCRKEDRNDYNAVDWFERMKAQFNVNRPVHYRVEGHSIVGDGWREFYDEYGVFKRQYHMNYGWGWGYGDCQGCNTWYTLDELYLGGKDEEYMLENIVPIMALGSKLQGIYVPFPLFPWYFDRDATGDNSTFIEGNNLQFLQGITVTCTSTTGGSIQFQGSSSANTLLFTRGDTSRGIRIYNGAIKLTNYGSIKLH